MFLKELAAFFEVLTVTNLAFLGFKEIQKCFNQASNNFFNSILKPIREKAISDDLQSNNVYNAEDDKKPNKILLKAIELLKQAIFTIYTNRLVKIKDNSNPPHIKKLPAIFKTMFLISGFYCLYCLIAIGLNQFTRTRPFSSGFILMIGLLVFYNIILFLIHFFFAKPVSKINSLIPITIILIFSAILTILYYFFYPSVIRIFDGLFTIRENTIIAILVACSPFILFFLRISIFHILTIVKIAFWRTLYWVSDFVLNMLYDKLIANTLK